MSNQVNVTSPSGTFTGSVRPDGQYEFRGIRFAIADRWAAPVDVETYDEIVEATSNGPISPQVPGFLEQMLGTTADDMSEDCLNLNVFTPSGLTTDSKLPVLYWIHGGAYTNGSGSIAWYDGSHLAARGCVVVSINYRLGAFGFVGEGNYGVLDMLSGLRWVQRNIASFGGNPDNVTIFGESAGGSAVISLMATDGTDDLFHKAWAMSPSIGQLRELNRAHELEADFLRILGVASLADAKTKSIPELLEAQTEASIAPSKGFDIFSPTGGGVAVRNNILSVASQRKIPFVVGTNKDENKLWSAFDQDAASNGQPEWEKFTSEIFGDQAQSARKTYEEFRPGEQVRELMSAVNTDVGFRQRAQDFVEKRCANALPSWMYWFTWATPAFGGILGSCHAIDIPFAFDNLDAQGTEVLTGDDQERHAIAERFAQEIVQFATHGHPSWEQFNTTTRPTMEINVECSLLNDPESAIRQLFIR